MLFGQRSKEGKAIIDRLQSDLKHEFDKIKNYGDEELADFSRQLDSYLSQANGVKKRDKLRDVVIETPAVQQIKAKVEAAQKRVEASKKPRAHFNKIMGMNSSSLAQMIEKLSLLMKLDEDTKDSIPEVKAEISNLRQTAENRAKQLLALLPKNKNAFAELFKCLQRNAVLAFAITKSSWAYDKTDLKNLAREVINPDVAKWNKAVAYHIDDPSLSDFLDYNKPRSNHDTDKLAAEALAKNDITLAKIAIAYYKGYYSRSYVKRVHKRKRVYTIEPGTLYEQLLVMVAKAANK